MLRRRGPRKGMSTFKAGLLALVALVVLVYLGFTKFANPFASQYTVHATFSNANGLKPGSPVRIAGVNVGQVTGVGAVPMPRAVTFRVLQNHQPVLFALWCSFR